jgi:two-component system sensor histidine kinase YesM
MPDCIKKAYTRVKNYCKALSIGRRMAVLYLLCAALPLLVTNLYANRTLYGNAQATQINAAENGFQQTLAHLNNIFSRQFRAGDNIALDQAINERLYRDNAADASMVRQIADMNAILAALTHKKESLDISNLMLYVDDEMLYSYHSDIIAPLSTIRGQGWYGQLTPDNRQAVFYTRPDGEGGIVFTAARKIRHLNALSEVKAVVCIDFPAEEIFETLEQGRTVDGSVSLIATADGTVVASSESHLPPVDLRRIIQESSPPRGLIPYNGQYLAQSDRLKNTDWHLVLIVSRRELVLTNARAWFGVIALMLVVTFPTVFAAKKILNGITGRIRELGKHMQSVRMGRLEPIPADVNRDEIGVMTDDYSFMITRMQQLLDERYRVGMEARQAELLALQSQINPHFLYNTLDMVQWMAKSNNTKEIQTVVKALANFYRLSLNKGLDMISLGDEVKIINNYMTIQHLRFGDSVRLEIDIDGDMLSCKLPKITLQPIIENALLHGILPKEDKRGTIRITGKYDMEYVCMEVTDDGVGTKLSAYDILQKNTGTNEYGQSGYGLYNIERRMCLIFGIEKCISLSSEPGGGMAVTLRFPAIRI